MLAKKFRFHGHGSLRYVNKNGQQARSEYITVRSIKNPRRNKSRAAVVVSRKINKRAVVRNQIRRRIYAVLREMLPSLTETHDIVVMVNSQEILNLAPKELQEHICEQFNKNIVFQQAS